MSIPELWIVAGPNGAGKTTLANREPIASLIRSVRVLNPDVRCLQLLLQQGLPGYVGVAPELLKATFLKAADEIFGELREAIHQNACVLVETVLSTDKYRPLVEEVRTRGGFFGLIYVGLNSPDLAEQRVRSRARLGGHDVPAERIGARWHRSLQQLPWFAARADRLLVYDNSDSHSTVSPLLVAEGLKGKIMIHQPAAIPELTVALQSASHE
jgi:predicted ABC-type ATPase